MSLSALPFIVLDTVLSKLDLRSLIALSSTCKHLHVQANKILYRAPAFEWIDCLCHRIVERCGLYTYEELAQLKIERELRTTYIVAAKKSQGVSQGVQDLGSQATKTCQCLGKEYQDTKNSPSLEIPEIRYVHQFEPRCLS